MARKSGAERQADRRQRLKKKGFREIRFDVSPEDHSSFKEAAKSENKSFYKWVIEKLRKTLDP